MTRLKRPRARLHRPRACFGHGNRPITNARQWGVRKCRQHRLHPFIHPQTLIPPLRLGRRSFATQSAISELCRAVEKDGMPEFYSRKAQSTALARFTNRRTPYGPLLATIVVAGVTLAVHCPGPDAALLRSALQWLRESPRRRSGAARGRRPLGPYRVC